MTKQNLFQLIILDIKWFNLSLVSNVNILANIYLTKGIDIIAVIIFNYHYAYVVVVKKLLQDCY